MLHNGQCMKTSLAQHKIISFGHTSSKLCVGFAAEIFVMENAGHLFGSTAR